MKIHNNANYKKKLYVGEGRRGIEYECKYLTPKDEEEKEKEEERSGVKEGGCTGRWRNWG